MTEAKSDIVNPSPKQEIRREGKSQRSFRDKKMLDHLNGTEKEQCLDSMSD